MSDRISFNGLAKSFGTTRAVDDLSLEIEPGEIHALLGASGSGKTTLLRLAGGLEKPDAGTVAIGNQVVAGDGRWHPPERRGLGMVFQDFALFPHLSVGDNVAFGLRARHKRYLGDRPTRVRERLAMVGLGGFDQREVHTLSGGQKQRVALARALADDPVALLLDEPFASLDSGLKQELRRDVRRLVRDLGVTTLLVTHDLQEAFTMADRVSVMNSGRLLQTAVPAELWARPVQPEVAAFFGIGAILSGEAGGHSVRTALGELPIETPRQGPVAVWIRPEQFRLEPAGAAVHELDVHDSGFQRLIRAKSESGDLLNFFLSEQVDPEASSITVAVSGPVHVFPG